MNEPLKTTDQLSIRDIPPISQELTNILNRESLHVKPVGMFDPERAIAAIALHEGELVTGVDIGGQKVAVQVFRVESGQLIPVTGIATKMGKDGDTYLGFLKAIKRTQFIGISCAGFLDGTVLADSANARTFTRRLKKRFGGDFARLFPHSHVALDNDAVAGVKAAGVEAFKRNLKVRNVLFVINGGGFGLAVLIKNPISGEWHILASEPGHLRAPGDLNPYHHEEACGVDGVTFTCIEKIIASKAGVEGTYHQVTGNKLDGRVISAVYQRGDEFATSLYDTSAIALAQVLSLEVKALELKLEETTVVFHGGAFEVPGYAARVVQALERYASKPHMTFKSKDFSENAGLTGAAIASLMLV